VKAKQVAMLSQALLCESSVFRNLFSKITQDTAAEEIVISALQFSEVLHIVTDFITALPGNGSVNSPTYRGGQQYSGGVY
jgi:hypothetical protein